MKTGRYKGQSLVDLDTPLTDYDKLVLQKVYGLVPEAKPVTRQPYDELTVKQKASRDYWRQN